MKKRTRRSADDRRDELMTAALKLAAKHGYRNVTRAQIAAACRVAESLVSYHFGTIPQFQRQLMREAIKQENALVVGQGLADGNTYARKAPEGLRQAAIAGMVS